jgi:UDP-2-acetamido-2,6-beta-L-arabino-hexul-4-ose reductase
MILESMLKVGITGQSGFIGTHLVNFLNLKKEEIKIIPFQDDFFENNSLLKEFVNDCDTIVHLAAMNRYGDQQTIYDTNIKLVNKLILALEETGKQSHVLFSSSSQEEKDNLYGKSKRDGRILFEQWAQRHQARFTGLVIPNVFGPFGNPFYNSVIATFCYQLTHNERPHIEIDANLQLIYINELVDLVYQKIIDRNTEPGAIRFVVQNTSENKVSEILQLLQGYRNVYFDKNCFPELNNEFEVNLFNTFRSYIDHTNYYPVFLKKNHDHRGVFIETIKTSIGGQFSFSTTIPGITRGNHFHIRKIERFIIIKGNASIELRRIGSNEILRFEQNGDHPSFVDMPIWYTHNITNIGEEELITLFWINEFFDPDDPDTYFEKV